MSLEDALTVSILLAALLGSVGFVGNGLYYERHGEDHQLLRWMRNLGVAVVWPLIVARAIV